MVAYARNDELSASFDQVVSVLINVGEGSLADDIDSESRICYAYIVMKIEQKTQANSSRGTAWNFKESRKANHSYHVHSLGQRQI